MKYKWICFCLYYLNIIKNLIDDSVVSRRGSDSPIPIRSAELYTLDEYLAKYGMPDNPPSNFTDPDAMYYRKEQSGRTDTETTFTYPLEITFFMDTYPAENYVEVYSSAYDLTPEKEKGSNLESVITYEGTHDIHLLITGQDITGISAFK